MDGQETEEWRRINPGEQTNDDQEQRGSFRKIRISIRLIHVL